MVPSGRLVSAARSFCFHHVSALASRTRLTRENLGEKAFAGLPTAA